MILVLTKTIADSGIDIWTIIQLCTHYMFMYNVTELGKGELPYKSGIRVCVFLRGTVML